MMDMIKDGLKDILGVEGYAQFAEMFSKYGVYVLLVAILVGAAYFVFYKPNKDLKKILGAQVQLAWDRYKIGEEDISNEEKLNKLVDKVIAGATKKIEDPTFKLRFKKLVIYFLGTEKVRGIITKIIKYEYSRLVSE